MSNILGSVVDEPLIITDHIINVTKINYWGHGTQLSRVFNLKNLLKKYKISFDNKMIDEIIYIWKLGLKSDKHITMSMATYIVCRYKGIPFDLTKLPNKRKRAFVYRCIEFAKEFNITVSNNNNDKLVLDLCDKLGDRSLYNEAKEIYPKARLLRGGNPKSTMGAIIYYLVKQNHKKVTHEYIAIELGLSYYTIRGAAKQIKELFIK